MAIKPKDMAKMIDHTILEPTVTVYDVKEKCDEAKEYEFTSVCVNPCFVPLAAQLLKNTSVKVCTVIGFPFGASTPETKAYETKDAVNNGAQEIDVVLNIEAIKTHKWEFVKRETKAVVDATKIAGVTKDIITKVVIEPCYLSQDEIKKVSEIVKKNGADFIKVSTGFASKGATMEDVSLVRKTVGRSIGVKAVGEINSFDDALNMLDAGANRMGTNHGIAIVTGEEE
ncbi:deoxyribose-phosphate aldolase [Natroniella acetigena]|uniref:deoxyribose-phosphate aldolase n=1 Tax=Natroniella acetigena TaxID=52004 RepID=UPI00200B7C5E|nr:deoxyribose-phosphate aldolase [Natroniella acetigena]